MSRRRKTFTVRCGETELRILREAARHYISEFGLRAFASAVGMSPTGASQFAKGETQPRTMTVRRIRRWYSNAYAAGNVRATAEGSALIGINMLVQYYPYGQQKHAALRVLEALHAMSYDIGVPLWIPRLKKLIEADWP